MTTNHKTHTKIQKKRALDAQGLFTLWTLVARREAMNRWKRGFDRRSDDRDTGTAVYQTDMDTGHLFLHLAQHTRTKGKDLARLFGNLFSDRLAPFASLTSFSPTTRSYLTTYTRMLLNSLLGPLHIRKRPHRLIHPARGRLASPIPKGESTSRSLT